MADNKRNALLDILKGLCILFIIVTHAGWSDQQILNMLFPFWIGQAVPVFMMISGYLYTKSLEKNGVLSTEFLWMWGGKKFIRYTIPFVIAFVVEIIPYLALHKISLAEALQALFTGGIGPGSYYYPVLVQLIFIFPLLYRIMKKRQAAGLVVVFILNALYETFAFLYGMGDTCYRLLVFRYIFIISAGIYVALYGELRKSVRLASSIIGAIFIVLFGYAGVQSFVVNTSWSGTSYLTVLFIAPIIGHIISKPVQMKKSLLTYLGRASYNIFLFQMVYYATIAGMVTKLVPNIYIRVFVNLFICSVGGVIFYEVEHRITDSVVPKYINSEAPLHEKWDKRLAKLSNAIQK